MKKLLSLILVLLMAVSFAACSKDVPANENNEETVSNKTEDKNNVDSSEEKDAETETENSDDNSDDNRETVNDSENVSDTTDKSEAPENPDTETGNNSEESKPPVENNSNKTLGNKLLDEFKSVAASGNALSVAEKLSAYSELSVLPMGAMEVEPGLLTGFDNAEITGFKEGATFMPMMGTIPFVGYVFTLEDGADISSFISTLTANANRRWNICTEAEETVTGSYGNKVFFVMCNKTLED